MITTVLDGVSKNGLLPAEKRLQALCLKSLSQRKDEVEGLSGKAMLKPYMSLGDFYDLQREEILISLSHAYGEYKRDKGANLAEAIKNKFLNHPIVAWPAVAITVLIVIVSLIGAINLLLSQNVGVEADVEIETHEN